MIVKIVFWVILSISMSIILSGCFNQSVNQKSIINGGGNSVPNNPTHQDISVTFNKLEKDRNNPDAVSTAFLSINDELVFRGWFEKFDNSPDTMPDEVKTFFYVLYADNEINNGGFSQYFYNGYGKYAANTVQAFTEIGAPEKSALLATVMSSFPDGKYPQSIDEFNELGENPDAENILEFLNGDFDSKYYKSNEHVDELMLVYIKKHFDKFAP
jgi:hypothetical protein